MLAATIVIAIAAAITAVATGAMAFIYWRISRQGAEQLERTDRQLAIAGQQTERLREQNDLTRELFAQSNRPRLEVELTNCSYDMGNEELSFRLEARNRGASAAHDVSISVFPMTLLEATPCVIHGIDIERDSTHALSHSGSLKKPAWDRSVDCPVIVEMACSYVGIDQHKYGFKERHRWNRTEPAFVRFQVTERTG